MGLLKVGESRTQARITAAVRDAAAAAAATRVKDQGECTYGGCLYEQGRGHVSWLILQYNIYLQVKETGFNCA